MLTPQQVLPLLCHSDHDVRLQAAEFFGDMADASPPETAAHLWQAIDQFGDVSGLLEIKERTSFLRILKEVPQDQASMARALELLNQGVSDENTERNLFTLFVALPLDFVNQHRTEILTAVDPETAEQIKHRLELQSMTGEQIWDELLKLHDQAEAAKSSSEVDFETAGRVVEALASHPVLAISRAEEVLAKSDDRYWLETWSIELLGKLRHLPSIDPIIEKMWSDQGDFMHPVAATALSRMDPPLTVPKLLAGYGSNVIDGDDEIYFRMRFTDALGKMKDPLAEAALIQLLEKETDPELISSICAALVDVCTTDGLEQLRKVVIEKRYDENLADIMEELVTLSKMVGFNPPEMPQWEAAVKNLNRSRERRSSMLDKTGLSKATFDMMQRFLGADSSAPPSQAPPEQSHSYEPARPFRREEPKIGRNDPCPCGSGKKYKKCCGK